MLRSMPTRPTTRRTYALLAGALVVAFALGLAVLGTTPAWAQGAEGIVGYDVAIDIEPSGAILVTEVIEYDFGSNERHGIFRDLPDRLYYDDTHDRVYEFDILEVSGSPGTPDQYEEEHPGGGILRLRIGDPDRTIDGSHTYTIRYRVQGALNAFPDHDELNWNVVGGGWDVSVARIATRVTAPEPIERVACYAGPVGSTLECSRAGLDGGVAVFSHPALDAHEAMTVVVAIPKGAVPEPTPILEERWSFRRAFTISPLTLGATGVVAAIVAAGLGWVAMTNRDRRWAGSRVNAVFGGGASTEEPVPLFDDAPYPVEYELPEGMHPGLVGTLVDENAQPLDVTATIVDLGVRGYLRIEEVPKEGLFGKDDWRLFRLREADEGDLLRYEQLLLDGLFEDGDEVLLSGLKDKFVSRLNKVRDALYDETVARGWFKRNPESVRTTWLVIALIVLAAGIGLEWGAIALTHIALVPIPIVIGGIVLLAIHRTTARRTAQGTAALWRVRGFRRFIETAEDERSRFAEEAQLFYSFLPYAIVFGLTERWARAFEGLAQAPDTAGGGWYVSSHPFAVASFTSSMNSFAVASTGTISSTPGSSGSGFSGGSSGGGGGGGGGGSW
jgi:uncharacterized membrane protein YgcG